MLIKNMKAAIPSKLSSFRKLENRGDPYYFDHWGIDLNNEECMYYWFFSKDRYRKNKKRVIINEVEKLLESVIISNDLKISRADFEKLCPITLSVGPCGFAVITRILEFLEIGEYIKNQGFEIYDKDEVQRILE